MPASKSDDRAPLLPRGASSPSELSQEAGPSQSSTSTSTSSPSPTPFVPLHTLPIALRSSRPSPNPAPYGALQRILFLALFLSAVLAIHGVQLIALGPLLVLRAAARVVRWRKGEQWAERVREGGLARTKGLFGVLLVAITVLLAPTRITLTSDGSVDLDEVVRPRAGRGGRRVGQGGEEEELTEEDTEIDTDNEEDKEHSDRGTNIGDSRGNARRARSSSHDVAQATQPPAAKSNRQRRSDGDQTMEIDLPERLIIMANHQAYTDWIYIWILGHLTAARGGVSARAHGGANALGLRKGEADGAVPQDARRDEGAPAGHGSRDIIILLKRSLKWIPVVGWGMQFYEFIFLNRSWAADRSNLTRALTQLGRAASPARPGRARGLWLLIFPEGTITSDEERAKSVRYAAREGVPDFVNCLHPRSTGLLFALRTLLPELPDLKVLDITIGYPGVPRGAYAQEWYNLTSVFTHGVPPPSIHLHLRMIDPARDGVPGLEPVLPAHKAPETASPAPRVDAAAPATPPAIGLATPDEATAFNLWLRERWAEKDRMLDHFAAHGAFEHTGEPLRGAQPNVVMPIVF